MHLVNGLLFGLVNLFLSGANQGVADETQGLAHVTDHMCLPLTIALDDSFNSFRRPVSPRPP